MPHWSCIRAVPRSCFLFRKAVLLFPGATLNSRVPLAPLFGIILCPSSVPVSWAGNYPFFASAHWRNHQSDHLRSVRGRLDLPVEISVHGLVRMVPWVPSHRCQAIGKNLREMDSLVVRTDRRSI